MKEKIIDFLRRHPKSSELDIRTEFAFAVGISAALEDGMRGGQIVKRAGAYSVYKPSWKFPSNPEKVTK